MVVVTYYPRNSKYCDCVKNHCDMFSTYSTYVLLKRLHIMMLFNKP